MEVRIVNIIKTLKNLPPPEFLGETRNFVLLKESWEDIRSREKLVTVTERFYTVTAQRFANGNNDWLEWVLDIKP